MRYVPAILVALACAACGSDTPTTPSPPAIPAANLQMSGQAVWRSCNTILGGCIFQGEGRNVGQGCAGTVRGVVRFYGPQQQQIGTAYAWSLGAKVVRPNEAFVYDTGLSYVPQDQTISTYQSEPTWTNVLCS